MTIVVMVTMVIVVAMVIMVRRIIMVRIVTIFFIHSGMDTPIGMASFPIMETAQPSGIHDHPYIPGPQVIVLVTHYAHIFGTIPGISVRNHSHRYDGSGRRCHYYRSRRHYYRRIDLD